MPMSPQPPPGQPGPGISGGGGRPAASLGCFPQAVRKMPEALLGEGDQTGTQGPWKRGITAGGPHPPLFGISIIPHPPG